MVVAAAAVHVSASGRRASSQRRRPVAAARPEHTDSAVAASSSHAGAARPAASERLSMLLRAANAPCDLTSLSSNLSYRSPLHGQIHAGDLLAPRSRLQLRHLLAADSHIFARSRSAQTNCQTAAFRSVAHLKPCSRHHHPPLAHSSRELATVTAPSIRSAVSSRLITARASSFTLSSQLAIGILAWRARSALVAESSLIDAIEKHFRSLTFSTLS